MILNTFRCVLNDWYLDYSTKESWFLKHVTNCQPQFTEQENAACYTFSAVDEETNIRFLGKAVFFKGLLKELELELESNSQPNLMQDIVESMLGEPDIRMEDRSCYIFENAKYSFMKDSKVLHIEFYKTYKKKKLHVDNPFKLYKVYRLRGISRFFGLFALIFLTSGYGYTVCRDITATDARQQEAIGTFFIFVIPFLLWTLRNLSGLYNMEYCHLGKRLKCFCDGRDRADFYKTLSLVNEELKDVEYKDYNIRITQNYVCIRDLPFGFFAAIPRKNIVDISYGTVTMRSKLGAATHTCLDIKAADGGIYKYTSKKRERMDEIRGILS